MVDRRLSAGGCAPNPTRRAIAGRWESNGLDPDQTVKPEYAGDAHVQSDHFQAFVERAPDWVAQKPKIINVQDIPQDGWGETGEVVPR